MAQTGLAAGVDFAALFENDLDAGVIVDADQHVLRVNHSFTRMFGYTAAEAVGRVLDQLIVPPHLLSEAASFRARMSTTGQVSQETARRRKDGSLIDVWVVATPHPSAQGERVVFVQYREITEQKRAQEVLRGTIEQREAALETFRLLIAHMGDGVLMATAELNVAAVNQAFSDYFLGGCMADDLVGTDVRLVIEHVAALTADADAFRALARRRIQEALPATDTVALRDGRVFERDYVPIRNEDGHLTGHLVHYHDLTETLRLQEQLRQWQKLEAIGRLAGGIAHDFNNLLTVLQGHAAMLLEDEALPADAREDLYAILKAADRAANLTRQLLAYSRQQVMRPELLCLRKMLASLEPSLARSLGPHIRLTVEAAPDTPAVRADLAQIEQVLLNLTGNARDAMPYGGELVVRAGRRTLEAPLTQTSVIVPAGTYAHIQVSDTGVGISDDLLPRVFDPFVTTKALGQGAGLGLATAYGIIKQSGGFILVDSGPARGARFDIYLPAAPVAES